VYRKKNKEKYGNTPGTVSEILPTSDVLMQIEVFLQT